MKQKHFCDVCGKGTENPYHFSSRSDRHIHICEGCVVSNKLDRCFVDLDRLRNPMVDGGLKLRLGGIYERTDGVLTGPLQTGSSVDFPFLDPRSRCEYTAQGTFWLNSASYMDLAREFTPE